MSADIKCLDVKSGGKDVPFMELCKTGELIIIIIVIKSVALMQGKVVGAGQAGSGPRGPSPSWDVGDRPGRKIMKRHSAHNSPTRHSLGKKRGPTWTRRKDPEAFVIVSFAREGQDIYEEETGMRWIAAVEPRVFCSMRHCRGSGEEYVTTVHESEE